jgi:hypothetical protein
VFLRFKPSFDNNVLRYFRNRGLSDSRSRQFLTSIVIVMLVSNTAMNFIGLEFYIIQLPYIGVDAWQPDVTRKLLIYDVGHNWLSRLNVSTSITCIFVCVLCFAYSFSSTASAISL